MDSLDSKECTSKPSDVHACSRDQEKDASDFCNKLLKDKRFSACHNVVDVVTILNACKWDYCACGQDASSKCACQTVEMYVRECRQRGVVIREWRDDRTCRESWRAHAV